MPDLNSHPYQAPLPGPEAMLTLLVTLQGAGQQLALAVAKPEWLGLVSHFTRMPPVERTRVGHSIQAATAHNPFPVNDEPLSPKQAALCETFVGDCVLLAALAEATTPRVLEGTALATYRLQNGNAARAQFH